MRLDNFPENPEAAAASQPDQVPALAASTPGAGEPAAIGYPAWSGLDVLRIAVMGFLAIVLAVVVLLLVVPGAGLRQRANMVGAYPELQIVAQMVAYLILLGYMYVLVTRERRCPRFWEAIHWNWPRNTQVYLVAGFVLQGSFLVVEWLLKRFIPKETPFDELLRRPYSLVLIAAFAVTLGPLMEELFFRGFLYPVLKRRFGAGAGIIVTALAFGLMHAAQYGYSWLSVTLISVVGIVLAVVRERTDSVAAGFLVHTGYNGTIMGILFLATDGFRHLDKLRGQ